MASRPIPASRYLRARVNSRLLAKRVTRRLLTAPFEALIALFAIVTAVLGLARTGTIAADAFERLLPPWAAAGFQLAYLGAGLALIVGLLTGYAQVEAAGLVLLGTTQVTRAVANAAMLGPAHSIGTVTFAALIVAACAGRLSVLLFVTKTAPHE